MCLNFLIRKTENLIHKEYKYGYSVGKTGWRESLTFLTRKRA